MKIIQKRDILISLVLILLSSGLFVVYQFQISKTTPKAEIYYGTERIKTIQLDGKKEQIFSFPQNENVVFHLFEDGSICFEKSNCKDQICVRSGKLFKVGESTACLPNQFILKIVSKDKENQMLDEPDIIR